MKDCIVNFRSAKRRSRMQVKNLTMKFILLAFATTYNVYLTIEIDDNQTFQKIDGFGFTLTGGSATSH